MLVLLGPSSTQAQPDQTGLLTATISSIWLCVWKSVNVFLCDFVKVRVHVCVCVSMCAESVCMCVRVRLWGECVCVCVYTVSTLCAAL